MNIWSDCKKLPLTEVLSFIVDNRGKTVPTTTSGHILIATNCIKNDRLYPCYEKIRFLSEDTYQSFFRSHPIPGDILFVCKGTPGRCALVPDPIDFCIAQDMVGLRTNKSIIDNKYLLAVLRSYEIQKFIYNTSVGDVIPHFKKQFFNKLLIPVPPMELQTKIGAFYYSISQKIENNNKINANLEAQAQALFKSWFVDFTPFKDQPFVDSELGPIPQGWKVVSLDEVCLKITDGSHFSPKDNPKEKIPMLSVKDMRKHGFDYQSCKHITESDFFKLQKNDCVPHVNDLLVAKDGSYLKEIFLCKKEIKQAILSSIAIFRPNTKLILPEYLLHYLKQPQVLKDVRDNYVSGSAVPRIVLKDFKKLKLCIPPMNSISTYRELLKSIEQLLLQKTEENQRLAALRDTLLPKLMSGEIKL